MDNTPRNERMENVEWKIRTFSGTMDGRVGSLLAFYNDGLNVSIGIESIELNEWIVEDRTFILRDRARLVDEFGVLL